ncbi:hypothetical protein M9Y55_21830 [Klebsiella oxytoca]|nr:hypothetical protein [Klebsiella oxytoca]MCL8292504.1 hypothetical protein [Klebsiella oxytoca]
MLNMWCGESPYAVGRSYDFLLRANIKDMNRIHREAPGTTTNINKEMQWQARFGGPFLWAKKSLLFGKQAK